MHFIFIDAHVVAVHVWGARQAIEVEFWVRLPIILSLLLFFLPEAILKYGKCINVAILIIVKIYFVVIKLIKLGLIVMTLLRLWIFKFNSIFFGRTFDYLGQ